MAMPTPRNLVMYAPEIVGPLTTTFSAPPYCAFMQFSPGYESLELDLGASCSMSGSIQSIVSDPACWPTGYVDDSNPRENPFSNFKAFSPGVACPLGWSSACGATLDETASTAGVSNYGRYLTNNQALTVCCPEGWHCALDVLSGTNPLFNCQTTFPAGATLTGYDFNGDCNNELVSTTLEPTETTPVGLAVPVHLINPATTTGDSVQGSTNSSIGGDTSASLSTTAKVGIGIGAAVIAVLLLVIATILCCCYIRSRAKKSQMEKPHSNGYTKPELDGQNIYGTTPSLASTSTHNLSPHQHHYELQSMPMPYSHWQQNGQPNSNAQDLQILPPTKYELPGTAVPASELHGNSQPMELHASQPWAYPSQNQSLHHAR